MGDFWLLSILGTRTLTLDVLGVPWQRAPVRLNYHALDSTVGRQDSTSRPGEATGRWSSSSLPFRSDGSLEDGGV